MLRCVSIGGRSEGVVVGWRRWYAVFIGGMDDENGRWRCGRQNEVEGVGWLQINHMLHEVLHWPLDGRIECFIGYNVSLSATLVG